MSIHSIDEDQLLQMIRIFQGYQQNFSTTFLQRKSQSHIQNLDTTIQDQLRQACIYIGDKEAFGKEVVSKALQIFNNIRAAMMIRSEKLIGFENKVEELEREIVRLESNIKILEDQGESSENTIQMLRGRVHELERGIEENEKNMNYDKKAMKESISAYTELEQTSNIKEKSLMNENEKISIVVNQYKQQMEILKEEIAGFKEEIKELSLKVEQKDRNIERLNLQKQGLETKQFQLEGIISEYQQQLKQKSIRSKGRKYSDREEFSLGTILQKEKENNSVIVDMRNLNEEFRQTEIIFEQDVFAYTNQLIQKANTEHYLGDFTTPKGKQNEKEKQNQKQKQKQKQRERQKQKEKQKKPNNQQTINRMMIDPYYAHFILTSQSVKIRLDHDEFLGIDFQKYYKEVMESGVQMHNWPTWIESKLKQLNPSH